MTLEMIKQYVEKYLALITSAGTFVTMGTLMCIANKVNNGGFFTFKNPNNAIIEELNSEFKKKYDEEVGKKAEEIRNAYSGLINASAFGDNIGDITETSGGKLTSDFIKKLKEVNEEKAQALDALGGNTVYSALIGAGCPYADENSFLADVEKIKNEELEKVKTEEIDLENFKFDNTNFKFENGKLALKDKDKR